ncbi:AAA family ATPase [Streptosporangium sp. NPDC051023]|uniref:helix-turn-helix transcriptional regulator n=1 Tax=Streptosporangium sp. NPDC051023 TaxID=3155410 RepID=UPI00344C8C3D
MRDRCNRRCDQSTAGPGRLIGRVQEIAQMDSFLARIRTAQGGTLVLSGAPGIGKSALLDHAATRSRICGMGLLRATGSQFEAEISYAALHQLLHPRLDELLQLTPHFADALKSALGLAAGQPPAPLLAANAILAFLRQMSQERPLLLIIDDLPWLDRASERVLGIVSRRLTGLPVGLIAACRTNEAPGFDQSDIPVLDVQPLSEEAAAELLRNRYPAMKPRVTRRLLDTALGNPLALLELPVSLGDLAHTPAGALPAALPLTRRLQRAFACRVQALPQPVYELLLLAALDGTGDLSLLRAIAADHQATGLGPAESAGLVHTDDSAARLAFRHPLIRSAVVDLSSSQQRRQAHADLATLLTDEPERHAWHLAEAADRPDENVAALLHQVAIASLRRGDSVGALTQLLRAAELSPIGKGRSRRLAEAAYLATVVTGDLHDAPRLLEQARHAQPGPFDVPSLAGARACQLLHADGDLDTAHRLLATALNELEDPTRADDVLVIEGLFILLMVCFVGGRADLWPPFLAAVDRLRPRPPELLAILSRTLSDPVRLAPGMLIRVDAAIAALDQEANSARIVRTGMALAYLDRLSHCREPLQRVIQDGREGRAVTSAVEALFLLAQDAFHTGRWEEAQELVDEGLKLCDVHGYDLLSWPGRLTDALLAAARGNYEHAIDTAHAMDTWARSRRAGIVTAFASRVQTLTALSRADYETAYRHAAAISPPGILAPYAPQALWVFFDLIEAALHTGRRTEAAAHLTAAQDLDLGRLSPRLRLIVLAGATLTGLDTDTTLLEAAIREPGNDRWPFDLARIQLTYGSHLRRAKRTTDARRHLAQAAQVFQQLQATPWAGRAERELRATGITISTAATGPAALTPQQLQIAQLAAAGHTNKQIAVRLFLSPRTVSTHLYQVFPKLGITSRAALRDALANPPDPHPR